MLWRDDAQERLEAKASGGESGLGNGFGQANAAPPICSAFGGAAGAAPPQALFGRENGWRLVLVGISGVVIVPGKEGRKRALAGIGVGGPIAISGRAASEGFGVIA